MRFSLKLLKFNYLSLSLTFLKIFSAVRAIPRDFNFLVFHMKKEKLSSTEI